MESDVLSQTVKIIPWDSAQGSKVCEHLRNLLSSAVGTAPQSTTTEEMTKIMVNKDLQEKASEYSEPSRNSLSSEVGVAIR